MYQSSSAFDKLYLTDIQDPIKEANEEDDVTQMSEKKVYEFGDKDPIGLIG